jgi:hypothetical protein
MLGDEVIICIRDSMEAEIRPRDAEVQKQTMAAANAHRLNGRRFIVHSEIGCQELTKRAEIIWQVIQRSYEAFATTAPDDSLISELSQQTAHWINTETQLVAGLVNISQGPGNAQRIVQAEVTKRRDELIKKFNLEARFYVQRLMNPPKSESGHTFNVLAPVGAIQTGANAQANIHIEAGGNQKLIDALEQLRAAIPDAPGMTANQRADGTEVVDDLITAVRAPRPNGPKVAGLLKGLALTVQTIGGLDKAWAVVREAASLLGIPLP